MHPLSIPHKDFFDTYNEAVLITSNKFEALYLNPAFTALTGYNQQNLPGHLVTDITAAPITENNRQWPCTKKDGTVVTLRVSESAITLQDETKAVLFTCTPITSAGAATTGDKKFYELADASPAMMFIEDAKGRAFYFNKAWLNFTGKHLAQLANTQWQSIIHPDDQPVLQEIKLSVTDRKEYAHELRLLNFDGAYRSLFIIGTPIYLNAGIFDGYMNSCLDITEVKEAQNKIAQLTYALKQSNEELEQFTYVTSHDLQEPLRMITGYIQLIRKSIEKGDLKSIEEFMQFVLSGSARMQMLITDLVQLSRINRKGIAFVPVNVNEVVEVAKTHLANKIKSRNAEITVGPLPTVMGDTFQLISLFENVLDNAIKFTSLEKAPVITISAEEKDEKYIFEVKDNGIGIDYKFHKRIFAIFQTLHARGEYDGTGIGLAVCKKIIERHGGEIWVEQGADSGSIFYFTIKK